MSFGKELKMTIKIDKQKMMRDLDQFLAKELDNWVKIHIMDYVSSDFGRPKSKEEETHGSITENR